MKTKPVKQKMQGERNPTAAFLAVLLLALSPALASPTTQPAAQMSFLDNGTLRVGVDLTLGGAITWVSKSGSDVNLVNSWDWGRQIQMSFYSGPIPFTPDGRQPAPQWRQLGWNPIQCGDHFKNRAAILEHRNDGKEIYVRCTPMQWPLNNVPGDCTFESRLTLAANTIHATSRILNHRADLTQYPGRHQELPAIYTNGPWYRLMTYAGDKPFSHGALTRIPAKMPWSAWNATENWAALVDDHDFGLGVWEQGVNQFCGGFNAKPGAGGPHDNPCGYIAPLYSEILDHNIDYRYSYVLILGSLDEIRKYVYDHADRAALPDYHFDHDRQHWYYHDAVDTGWPIKGMLDITTTGKDAYLVGPTGCWNAADAPTLCIEAAFDHTRPTARVRWKTFANNKSTDHEATTFPITPDGQFRVYEVKLAGAPGYDGPMVGLRLDPLLLPDTPGHIRIKSITFKRPTN